MYIKDHSEFETKYLQIYGLAVLDSYLVQKQSVGKIR
jgi:hypothetical protein